MGNADLSNAVLDSKVPSGRVQDKWSMSPEVDLTDIIIEIGESCQ